MDIIGTSSLYNDCTVQHFYAFCLLQLTKSNQLHLYTVKSSSILMLYFCGIPNRRHGPWYFQVFILLCFPLGRNSPRLFQISVSHHPLFFISWSRIFILKAAPPRPNIRQCNRPPSASENTPTGLLDRKQRAADRRWPSLSGFTPKGKRHKQFVYWA